MTKRYRLVGLLLKQVESAPFESGAAFRLAALIYRIKYLLLKLETDNEVDMGGLCPMEELIALQTLLQEAIESHRSIVVQQRIEDSLLRIVQRMEDANPHESGKPSVFSLPAEIR